MTNSQVWDPHQYAHHARFVSDLGAPVVALLAPLPGERILDLGCGDGVIARNLADRGCKVVAVDASPAQIEAARSLGVDARVMDGEGLAFDEEFDAVFSNAALHWMKRPGAVIAGAFRALVPGGRFVAEFGGKGCVETIRGALMEALGRRGVDGAALDPWYFPDVEEYGARLSAAGFRVEAIQIFPRPTPLPTDVAGWLETFAQTFLAALPADAAPVRRRGVRGPEAVPVFDGRPLDGGLRAAAIRGAEGLTAPFGALFTRNPCFSSAPSAGKFARAAPCSVPSTSPSRWTASSRGVMAASIGCLSWNAPARTTATENFATRSTP